MGAAIAYVIMPWLIPFLYSYSFESAVTPARIMLIAAVFNFALLWRKTLLAALGGPKSDAPGGARDGGAPSGVGGLGGSGSGGRSDRGVGRCGRGRFAWVFVARGLMADRPESPTPRDKSDPQGRPEQKAAGATGAVR